MELLAEEKIILYSSYLKIAAAGPQLTTLFYNRLFEVQPPFRALFKTSMEHQGIKWRMMLNLMLQAVDSPYLLRRSLVEMGRRHIDYGVKAEDYPLFIDCVIWALQQYLDVDFTSEVEAAWHKLFAIVVDEALKAYPS